MSKLFHVLNSIGECVARDLEAESASFSRDEYLAGGFDSYNYQWYENFNHHVYDDNGCDYERYGCVIRDGDSVLDLGANVGIFAHRAESRGASKVTCFEPVRPTFECLEKNAGTKTSVYNAAVGGSMRTQTFRIYRDYSCAGGGTSVIRHEDMPVAHEERALTVNVNDVFRDLGPFDFMKVDTEGAEKEIMAAISDENLRSLRCLAMEIHPMQDQDEFVSGLAERMSRNGFNHFILHHNGGLKTANFWMR